MNKFTRNNTENAASEASTGLWGISALRCHYYGIVFLSLLFASTVTGRIGQDLDEECAVMQLVQDETVECLNQLQDLVRYLHPERHRSS